MTQRKKLIEVALPLEAINIASAREKSIRHGHPSTLHLWWARRPLATARAVIFASLVDDPNDPHALPAFVRACETLPRPKSLDPGQTVTPRDRLFYFIERLVQWESTTDEALLAQARELIMIATEGNPPPLLDPFAGGGSIPLEAQRLGLEAHASDLNPVAVMINKAQIEIPPRFANLPPVNPRDNPLTLNPSPTVRSSRGEGLAPLSSQSVGEGSGERGNASQSVGEGSGVRGNASQSVGEGSGVRGNASQSVGEGSGVSVTGAEEHERWQITPQMRKRMTEIARHLRKNATPSEDILWQALRNRQLDGKKFKRQVDIGAFVLDFYCAEERLAVEVDGGIHALQQEADKQRQSLLESLGIRFVRLSAELVETNLAQALKQIQAAFKTRQQAALPLSSRSVGEGAGGEGKDTTYRGASGLAADVRYYGEWMREKAWERIGHLYPKHPHPQSLPQNEGGKHGDRGGETVIAWLWARTVKCPNPACGADMPLVTSFEVSKKKGRQVWIEPIIKTELGNSYVEFVVRREQDGDNPKNIQAPPKTGRGARFDCLVCGEPAHEQHIKAEGMAGRMDAKLMTIVTEGKDGRNYYSPQQEQQAIAKLAQPAWKPSEQMNRDTTNLVSGRGYGFFEWADLFTPRQLVALTTFSDLVAEAREQAHQDALLAGLPDDNTPLRDGGRGAFAYAEAVSVYLAFAVDRCAMGNNSLTRWNAVGSKAQHAFGRQALPMIWDYCEVNPFTDSTGSLASGYKYASDPLDMGGISPVMIGHAIQLDATTVESKAIALSTDPPYYDNIGYADLSDFFYVWMRRNLRSVYPDIFSTVLVPKEPELVATPYRFDGDKAKANQFFEDGMVQAFSNMRRFVHDDYPLTVYYAFKQQESEDEEDALTLNPSPTARSSRGEGLDTPLSPQSVGEGQGVRGKAVRGEKVRVSSGWETMLNGILQAGFSINGTYPVRTEMKTRLVSMGTNALASSIVIVCRPRPQDAPTTTRRHFMEALRQELPPALANLQSGNVAPVDMAQSSIGPGMAVYSRYSKVLEADGSTMGVRVALGIINQALDEYFSEQDGDIDTDTRFAVAWFEQFGFKEGDFGQADTLARAKNTSVDGIRQAGIAFAEKGKVRLIHWKEYDPSAWNPQTDKRATVWEATHHLIERLHHHGEQGAADLMEKMTSEMASEARALAYRLYNICERKSWTDHARDYNALVVSWSGIGEASTQKKLAKADGQGTKQMDLF